MTFNIYTNPGIWETSQDDIIVPTLNMLKESTGKSY